MSVEATFHKNALIKNLVILFVFFFCAVEPIYSFFKPIGFFDLISMFFFVDIENNYLKYSANLDTFYLVIHFFHHLKAYIWFSI